MAIRRPQAKRKPSTNYRDTYFDNNKSNNSWYYCEYCGKPIRRSGADIDHVNPQVRGGSNGLGNLVVSCPHCNRQKGAMTGEEYDIWKEVVEDEEDERFERDEEKFGFDEAVHKELMRMTKKKK